MEFLKLNDFDFKNCASNSPEPQAAAVKQELLYLTDSEESETSGVVDDIKISSVSGNDHEAYAAGQDNIIESTIATKSEPGRTITFQLANLSKICPN